MTHSPIFVAIDTPQPEEATRLIAATRGAVGGIKLGLEFFVANGPSGLAAADGAPLFLDLKLHDIPNTVAGAVRSAQGLGARYLTIHAGGGPAMVHAAASAAAETGADRPLILAVTVLTSMSDADLDAVGQRGPALDQVRRLAEMAHAAGADGAVCSPHEVARLRADRGPDFHLVVPGVRPSWAAADDQKRIMTPEEAMAAGATALVIGRPITRADDPGAAARRILADIEAAR